MLVEGRVSVEGESAACLEAPRLARARPIPTAPIMKMTHMLPKATRTERVEVCWVSPVIAGASDVPEWLGARKSETSVPALSGARG